MSLKNLLLVHWGDKVLVVLLLLSKLVDKLWATNVAFAGCDCRHGFPIGDNFVGEPARQPCRFSAPALPSRHYLAGLNLGLNIIASEYVSDGYIDIYGYLASTNQMIDRVHE